MSENKSTAALKAVLAWNRKESSENRLPARLVRQINAALAEEMKCRSGWERMTSAVRRIQARHVNHTEGDVYHTMQSLVKEFGCNEAKPLLDSKVVVSCCPHGVPHRWACAICDQE